MSEFVFEKQLTAEQHDVYQFYRQYLLNKPETEITYPFSDDVQVYKVKGKMFALIGVRQDKIMFNLKCDPDESVMVRDIFPSITPAYHMNKKHWISVYLEDSIPQGEVLRLIDNSFKLVVRKMPKKDQTSLLLHME